MSGSVARLQPVQRARERCFDRGEIATGLRDDISSSWARSLAHGVPRDPQFRFEADLDLDTRLCRAARPVFDRLSDRLSGTGTSLFLANEHAVLLERWVDTTDLGRRLDRAFSVPGAALDEQGVGTNGVGTILAASRPLAVTGPEHWAEGYQTLSCAGAPIRNGVTGRIEGVLTVTCERVDEHPVVLSLVHEAACDIERELVITASRTERALLDAFLSATRRTNRAVMTASQGIMITTPAAARLCERIDQSLLWEHIADAERTGREAWVVFPDGASAIEAGIRPRDAGGRQRHGVVIEFHQRPAQGTSAARTRHQALELPNIVGQSDPWRACVQELLTCVSERRRFVVRGEPGVGKLALLQAALTGEHDAPVIFDAALEPIDGTASWVNAVRAQLANPTGTVVLRHLALLSDTAARALVALLDLADGARMPRIVATVVTSADHARPALRQLEAAIGTAVVDVPPLRQRRDDIRLLVRHYGGGRRWTSDAHQVLLRQDWPGNVRQLRQLVETMPDGPGCADVTLSDLPPEMRCRSARRRMTRIEEIELSALLAALKEANGNKSRAAELLGISRSTVHRKLAASGVDLSTITY